MNIHEYLFVCSRDWLSLPSTGLGWTTDTALNLELGAHYRFEVAAVNKAKLSSKHPTTGVTVDYTPPVVTTIYYYIPAPKGGGYIGLVSLLGVSLQLTLPSGCFVRYLRPQ